MDFPDSFVLKVIKELKPGQVIRCPLLFEDKRDPICKRLIVLSYNNSEIILGLTTTSNKFAPTRYYGKDDIYIEPGSESIFEEPTYVQLHRVKSLETKKVIKLFTENKVTILGNISDELLGKVYERVDRSEKIEGKYRKRIIEEYNKAKYDKTHPPTR